MIKFVKEIIIKPVMALLNFVFGMDKLGEPILIPIKTTDTRVRRKH